MAHTLFNGAGDGLTNEDNSSLDSFINGDAWITAAPNLNMTSTINSASDVTRYTECQWELSACRAQKYLFLIAAPILILMSTIGNGLGLAVMSRKSLKNTATAVFISCLAVSDTVAVWTGLSRHFIFKLTKYDIRQYSVWACRFQRFFLYTSLDTSSWILAAVTIERFLAVCIPQRHQLLKSTEKAWKTVIGIVVFQILFNVHVFFNYGQQTITKDNETTVFPCGFSSNSSRVYILEYHVWVSFAVYSLMPWLVMITLNIFIISRLRQMQQVFKKGRHQSSGARRRQASNVSMTKMLLSVTCYFVVVTTPTFIFTIIQNQVLETKGLTPEKYAKYEVVDAVSTLLLYLNHSINFFLYCASGKRFQRELKLMLSCTSNMKEERNMLTTGDTKSFLKKSTDQHPDIHLNSLTDNHRDA